MKSKFMMVVFAAFLLSLTLNCFAFSDALPNFKVAVVNVQDVVANSAEVKALKAENEQKIKDLITFVDTAKSDLSNEADAKKKKDLEDKYNKQLNSKKKALDKEYASKLAKIDKDITAVIAKEAKAKGYDMVFAKGVVLYGGTDITSAIKKAVR